MVSTPDQEVATEATRPEPPPRAPTAWQWPAAAAGMGLAVAWLALRPEAPGGVAAVVDLLVLPAVLFLEIRLLAGRPAVSPAAFAVFFGLGAVFAGVTALVLERAAASVVGRSAMHAVGPLVEASALSAPLLVVAVLVAAGRRWTIADLTLAGLASGLGILLVQTALTTGAIHAAPAYQSPLLAGLQRLPASAGSRPVYFVGHALATALVGLALGVGLRFRARAWRLVPAGLALSLVVLDHGLFDWRLRHLVNSEAASASGLVDVAQRLTLDGRLALVLLLGGLVAARLIDGRRARGPGGTTVDLQDGAEGDDAAEPAPPPVPPSAEGGADAEPDGAPDSAEPPPRRAGPAWAPWVALAVAVVIGVALTLLARNRQLGLLDNRYAALAVSLLGLGYALWHLPAVLVGQPVPALRHVLGAAAVVSSGLGVLCALLPSPDAAFPVHGGLLLETVLGWGAGVGNLGFVLGLGGLAAPPGSHGNRRFGDQWSGLVVRRLRWTGWFGPDRSKGGAGGWDERVSWRGRDARRRRRRVHTDEGPGGSIWWARLTGGRLGRLLGRRDRQEAAMRAGSGSRRDQAVAIAIEPHYRSPVSQMEFVGATVKEAVEAAMRQVGVDLAHNSLQLVDEGMPPKPGKPGTGRPARVRVAAASDDADAFLVPPARDSITRNTPFVVVVEVAGGSDQEPAPSVQVTLRATHALRSHARTLTCARVDSPPERPRYRSNPYSVEAGEDTTWARTSAGAAVVPAAGIRVDNGGEVRVEHRGERAAIAVYDGWVQQVLGVNRWLLDLTGEHHRQAVAELEEQLEGVGESGGGSETDRIRSDIRRHVGRLEARLAAVEEGRRLLSETRSGDPATHDDVKAFMSTALLHVAMSVDDQDDVMEAAAGAFTAHRRGVESGPTGNVGTGPYRDLLAHTVLAPLWASGAYSGDDVARLLGWERFTTDDAGT